jgi:DNA repair protein RecN (Recombination protein N)
MLVELRVRDVGVIDDLALLFHPGMTALTGETGAGKTLVVEAIELLLGGRADPMVLRPGASEAMVEGRFALADAGELVAARAVPANGRSRAYLDGRMATVSALGEATADLVDLHGQHTHQALLSPATQRDALDRAGAIDTAPVVAARAKLGELDRSLSAVGGDPRARARETDLLAYQLDELEQADLADPDEDARLEEEQDRLAGAAEHRRAAAEAHQLVGGDGAAADQLGAALAAVAGRTPLAELEGRLRGLAAELEDASSELRNLAERLEDDPDRLAAVGERRRLLAELRRKYGDTLEEVIAERERIRGRLAELAAHDQRAAELEAQRRRAAEELAAAERAQGQARRRVAPILAADVERQLRTLAMPRAQFEVAVGDDPAGDGVDWLLAANPGEPALPLAKVASGGELARTMLAARLILGHAGRRGTGGPVPDGQVPEIRTLVFDEVDAGIGGEAAVAVGRALADLATRHQVLVVTHLAQVAAFADHHVAVTKDTDAERTVARARPLAGEERVVELSRMLSGRPDSATAHRHAAELLAQGAQERGARPRSRRRAAIA